MAWRHALVGCVLLAACGLPEPPQQAAVSTAAAPTATAVPKRPDGTATAFFTAWQQGQYAAMYDLLSAEAQAATSRDLFLRRYANIHDGIGETRLIVEPTGPATRSDAATTTSRTSRCGTCRPTYTARILGPSAG